MLAYTSTLEFGYPRPQSGVIVRFYYPIGCTRIVAGSRVSEVLKYFIVTDSYYQCKRRSICARLGHLLKPGTL